MSRQAAHVQYMYALKLGQKYYRECVVRGKYPYQQSLSDVFNENLAAAKVNIGLVDIPTEQIVGTTTSGRGNAFAGNFMPLLHENTEFGMKWISLCTAHLGAGGISDPIVCYEYMGHFYVTEGNKRVSVLKSYEAPTIPGNVTRIIPTWSEDEAVQLYYEFMPFFDLSGLYDVTFTTRGSYAKLQARLGFEPDHVWTKEERSEFLYGFRRFKEAFLKVNNDKLDITPGDALLVWLQMNPVEDLQRGDLVKSLTAAWPDVRIFANGSAISVSTEPESEEKAGITRILGFGRPNHLNIAFVQAMDPDKSSWTASHETGRKQLENTMGDKINVKSYIVDQEDPLTVMERAVEEGAQVLFATTPPLIAACRQIAVRHPNVKVLNCSVSMPYSGVRTYYGRMYEAKFITGAIAGAMADGDRIGYVANYPIIGTIASINAFALGARLTNPNAKIVLRWSCLPGNPVHALMEEGVSVISNREATTEDPYWAWEWGTYKVEANGDLLPLSSPVWNWGKFYEGVVQSIFDGGWNSLNAKEAQAINYWWGMRSGVIDVTLNPDLPQGSRQLSAILRHGLVSGSIDPFHTKLIDRDGNVRSEGEKPLTAEDVMSMDWLLENVDGVIPAFDELLPVSQQLVRLLGLKRNEIQPTPEEVIL